MTAHAGRLEQNRSPHWLGLLLILMCVAIQFTARPAHTQASGSLAGTILRDSVETPLVNAEIAFPTLKMSARSDDKGNFRITSLPVGSHEIVVRLVGYEPYSANITFRPAQQVEADFVLKPVVTKLANVSVKAAADSRYAVRLHDFEERRKSNPGRFLTADEFEKAAGRRLADVISGKIPGARTVGKGNRQVLMSLRGKECPVQVIVNGMVRYNGAEETFDINTLITDQVIGMEYYTVATTPSLFNATATKPFGEPPLYIPGGSHCGTVVIWTR